VGWGNSTEGKLADLAIVGTASNPPLPVPLPLDVRPNNALSLPLPPFVNGSDGPLVFFTSDEDDPFLIISNDDDSILKVIVAVGVTLPLLLLDSIDVESAELGRGLGLGGPSDSVSSVSISVEISEGGRGLSVILAVAAVLAYVVKERLRVGWDVGKFDTSSRGFDSFPFAFAPAGVGPT
jgi:hypothetical protein